MIKLFSTKIAVISLVIALGLCGVISVVGVHSLNSMWKIVPFAWALVGYAILFLKRSHKESALKWWQAAIVLLLLSSPAIGAVIIAIIITRE